MSPISFKGSNSSIWKFVQQKTVALDLVFGRKRRSGARGMQFFVLLEIISDDKKLQLFGQVSRLGGSKELRVAPVY